MTMSELKSDTEQYELGVVVMTVHLKCGSSEVRDWHPDDAEYAREFSEETSFCEDVKSVDYYNALTNGEESFLGCFN